MRSSSTDSPDGYRRYVYRINVKLPSKFPQLEPRKRRPELEIGRGPDIGNDQPHDVNIDPPDNDKKKKKDEDEDEEKKTT